MKLTFSTKLRLQLLLIALIGLFFSSCGSLKEDVVYFQDIKNYETLVDTDSFTPTFKVNDIVSINVSTFDLNAVKPFNLVKSVGENGRTQEIDYLVDIEGNIDYPVLGKIKLLGLTVGEAKEVFKEKLNEYLSDPIINIRIINFRITVLGEVSNPGTYNISGERINILEALGLAGDLTMKGRRDNVMVVRDFNGAKTYTRIDLTGKEVFNSPVYYLTQNDVIYVEPNNSAMSSSKGDSRTGIILSITSVLISLAILISNRIK